MDWYVWAEASRPASAINKANSRDMPKIKLSGEASKNDGRKWEGNRAEVNHRIRLVSGE
jgi:hypothetical protein